MMLEKPMPFRYPDNPVRQYVDSDFFINLMKNEPKNWLAQRKVNGWRRPGYRMGFWTFYAKYQTGNESKSSPPPALVEEMNALKIPDGTAIDMEWMGMRDTSWTGGRHWFEAFDLLYWKNEWQGDKPLAERYKRLQEILAKIKTPSLVLVPLIQGNIISEYERLKSEFENRGKAPLLEGVLCEGLVVKRRDSLLKGGFRDCDENGSWMKIKYREV